MNVVWSVAKRALDVVAPAIAHAIGGPIMGPTAARIVSKVLGIPENAPPEVVAQAVQNARPDQIVELEKADKEFQLRYAEIEAKTAYGQVELNKIEASSGSWYIAGWRPFIGWTCGIGFAWNEFLGPFAFSFIRIWYPNAELLQSNSGNLQTVMLAMLGFGVAALRSIDKATGTAGGEVVVTPRQKAQILDKRAERIEPIVVGVPVPSAEPLPKWTPDTPGVIELKPERKPRFFIVNLFTRAWEGEWADHPEDNGGPTMRGVTLKTYRDWRNDQSITKEQLRQITDKEASEIFLAHYWNACRCDDMPPGVDVMVYDMAITAGPGRSVKLLQTVLGVDADGAVGPVTLAALESRKPTDVIERLAIAQQEFYKSLADFRHFGNGWMNRTKQRKEVALREVTTA